MKKILSMLLAVLLLLGCLPSSVAAADEPEVARYSVLILDTSGSMSGTPVSKQKLAAIKFCNSVLAANGTNYVAVVKLNTSSSIGCDFTDDIDVLTEYINNIPASGGTNINQALQVAEKLLDSISVLDSEVKTIKNVILCSDGLPESGSTTSSGPYTSEDHSYYRYANACYNTAALMKEKYNIYTLGFFHSLSGSELSFANRFMNDLQNAGYYPVNDPEDLEFTFGDIADDITKPSGLQEIEFTYQSGSDYTATCYYTDDYFAESSYKYNHSLGTMSLAFAMTAFGSGNEKEYINKSVNANNLLQAIGMKPEAIQTNGWFTVKPTTDSIGVIVGSKPMHINDEDYTLIALAVRGGGYEQEWASNFTIGLSGQHDGFDRAKSNVLEFLQYYVSEQNISGKVKFWITGYSRAAATANLLGGALDDDAFISNDIEYDYDDIYTYCFETPAGALTEYVKNTTRYFDDNEDGVCYKIYNNIFNIINSSDPVPYVAPAALGFGRYGIDRYLPSAEADANYAVYDSSGHLVGGKLRKMLDVYNALSSTGEYVVDNFQMKKLGIEADINWDWFDTTIDMSFILDDTKNNYSQGAFLSNYVTILSKDFIKNRSIYVATYQDEIREVCSVVFGCTDEQSKQLMTSILAQAKENWGALAWSYVYNTGVKGLIGAGDEYAALQIISDWLNTAIKDAGITDYDEAMIDRAGKALSDLMLALVVNHPNYCTTAVINGRGLGAAHYPELCFAWMASMDDNYDKSNSNSFNNGSYRVIRINCAVDVDVFDDAGQIVASIKNDEPQNIFDSSIISAINEDDEKVVILPVDTAYRISITAREDDLVNYGIDEYCALAGDYTRAVDYFNIKLVAGEEAVGYIPAYSQNEIEFDTPNGSTVDYTVVSPSGDTLESDSDLTGDAAVAAYYEVTAIPSNDLYGVVLGSGIHQYGSFAKVEAHARKGYTFDGWYAGEKCVSSSSVYRFCVTEDTTLVAKFAVTNNDKPISPNPKPEKPSEVKNDENIEDTVFADVPNDSYYEDAVIWAVDKGITMGVSANRFDPDGICTRAQAVTFLWRAAGSPAPKSSAMPFIDVPAGSYYYNAVLWAVENGITKGTSDAAFSPDKTCTRAQIVTFLWRSQNAPAAGSNNPFTDVAADDYYADAVLWAVKENVTKGTGSTTFSPDDNCTRAQIVTFLWRTMA